MACHYTHWLTHLSTFTRKASVYSRWCLIQRFIYGQETKNKILQNVLSKLDHIYWCNLSGQFSGIIADEQKECEAWGGDDYKKMIFSWSCTPSFAPLLSPSQVPLYLHAMTILFLSLCRTKASTLRYWRGLESGREGQSYSL